MTRPIRIPCQTFIEGQPAYFDVVLDVGAVLNALGPRALFSRTHRALSRDGFLSVLHHPSPPIEVAVKPKSKARAKAKVKPQAKARRPR